MNMEAKKEQEQQWINLETTKEYFKELTVALSEINKYEAELNKLNVVQSANKINKDAGIDSRTPIENVAQIVNHSLAYPIPIDTKYAELIIPLIANSASFQKLVEFTSDKTVALKFLHLFQAPIVDDFEPGLGKASLIYYIDTLIKIPMAFLSKFLKNHIQFQRNNQTSEIINQPDFLAWNSNSILVLKGVEEELAEDFHFAKKKILDKCDEMHEMFFGTIPFFFCYAVAGKFIQFFVVDKHKNVTPTTKNRFDMSCVQDRLEIVVSVLNITWCINEYQKFCRNVTCRFDYWISRDTNVSMYFGSDGLTKKIDLTKKEYKLADLNVVKEIYELIKHNDILNTIKCDFVKLTKSSFTILLNPICLPYEFYKIESNEELLKALKGVANALRCLHLYNFVHRDVRWNNILFDFKSKSYLLTDFECASRANTPLTKPLRKSVTIDYPMQIRKGNIYTKQVDLYLFGKLIESKQKENIFAIHPQNLKLINKKSDIKLRLFDFESEQLTAEYLIGFLGEIFT